MRVAVWDPARPTHSQHQPPDKAPPGFGWQVDHEEGVAMAAAVDARKMLVIHVGYERRDLAALFEVLAQLAGGKPVERD